MEKGIPIYFKTVSALCILFNLLLMSPFFGLLFYIIIVGGLSDLFRILSPLSTPIVAVFYVHMFQLFLGIRGVKCGNHAEKAKGLYFLAAINLLLSILLFLLFYINSPALAIPFWRVSRFAPRFLWPLFDLASYEVISLFCTLTLAVLYFIGARANFKRR
ncbi:MAG: hypothetical protein FWE12_00255 [Oscillospiraceae bacterium]|nr:hypothetical protein [Oscillospiraceae bacterium]